MDTVSWYVAIGAGLLSFFSPCVLALVPAYVSMLTGSVRQSIGYTLKQALMFVVGFTLLFLVLGLSATGLARTLAQYRGVLQRVGGIFIFIFGLHMSQLVNVPLLSRTLKVGYMGKEPGLRTSFLLGVAFAVGWTPCVGPVLGSILFLAAWQDTLRQAIYLLGLYSLGLGIPFLVFAAFIHKIINIIPKIQKTLFYVHRVAGLLLMLMGLAVFFNWLPRITAIF